MIFDRLLPPKLSLEGKTVAVTGASGTLGKALLCHLYQRGAIVIGLTSKASPLEISVQGETIAIQTLTWQIGQEEKLAERLATIDILILNHGINVHGARDFEAIDQSYQVNTFSQWRLLQLFLNIAVSAPVQYKDVPPPKAGEHPPVLDCGENGYSIEVQMSNVNDGTVSTPRQDRDIPPPLRRENGYKEVWVNTSEAEVNPAFSPLYELSKRTLGDLITLRRLDAPCTIRKLILGPFRSNLNPIGIMSADWVAQQILNLAQRDCRNIIVTINPLTYLLFPGKELLVSAYFRLFTE